MPSAHLRNPRSLASPTSTLLPLLAPRAFAEAPSFRGRTRQDDRRSQEKQKKKRDRGQCCSLLSRTTPSSANVGLSYADIFSFTRQQLRTYRPAGARVCLQRGVDTTAARRQVTHLHGNNIVQGMAASSLEPPMTTSTPPSLGASDEDHRQGTHLYDTRLQNAEAIKSSNRLTRSNSLNGRLFGKKRKNALALAQRYKMAVKRYEIRTNHYERRRKHGKFRSLQRRLFSYEIQRTTEVDLAAPFSTYGLISEDSKKNIMRAFAALDRDVYPRLKRESLPLHLKHHPMCVTWTNILFRDVNLSETGQLWRNWLSLEDITRDQGWPYLLIYLLRSDPGRALAFIEVLCHKPCVESLEPEIIADAFEYLSRVCANGISHSNPAPAGSLQHLKSRFMPTFYHVFREHLIPYKRICSQDLLLNLARIGSIAEFGQIYSLFQASDVYLGFDVLLHYADTFTKAGHHNQGLGCLKRIAESAMNGAERLKLVSKRRFRWSCAVALRSSMMDVGNYHETTTIVATFVELGVALDIALYNTIIRNAMNAGDYPTAFKVYNSLEQNGLKADTITFSTLLHGCTTTEDAGKFEEFALYCAETAKELNDPWLAADYLYYLWTRSQQRRTSTASESDDGFQEIFQSYARFFSRHALQPFWSTSLAPKSKSTQDGVLTESAFMEPPSMALYLMLQIEILKATRDSREGVWTLYLKFTQLVGTNYDPSLSTLAQDPIIWNAFLLAFCKAKQFSYASQLVKRMTDHGPQPNIYTWNIFMRAFFLSQQTQAAERVFEIMRSRGTEPNQITYETLLEGYARAQNIEKIGEVLDKVGDQDQLDEKLVRDLARVHDRKRMMVELEQARARWKRKQESERAEEAALTEERWKAPVFRPLLEAKEIYEDVSQDASRFESASPTAFDVRTTKR